VLGTLASVAPLTRSFLSPRAVSSRCAGAESTLESVVQSFGSGTSPRRSIDSGRAGSFQSGDGQLEREFFPGERARDFDVPGPIMFTRVRLT